MASDYDPRKHAPSYDVLAWERCAAPFAPSEPMPAWFSARVAADLFGASSSWDAIACYACLTHGAAPLQLLLSVLFQCDGAAATALLLPANQPWLELAMRHNIRVKPVDSSNSRANWALVQTADNKRYIVQHADDAIVAVFSAHNAARKPPGHLTSLVKDARHFISRGVQAPPFAQSTRC